MRYDESFYKKVRRLSQKGVPLERHGPNKGQPIEIPKVIRSKSPHGRAKASLAPIRLEFDAEGTPVAPDVSHLLPDHQRRYLDRWQRAVDEYLSDT